MNPLQLFGKSAIKQKLQSEGTVNTNFQPKSGLLNILQFKAMQQKDKNLKYWNRQNYLSVQ